MNIDNPKILVFRYRFLGDTILTVPFLKQLKHAYPNSHVAVLVAPQSGVLLENCPYVDELIEFDTTRFHKYDSQETEKKSFWHYAFELRKRDFDIAYVLKRSFSSAFLAWFARIPQRIGFDTEMRGIFLTNKITFDPKKHEVLNYLAHLEEPFSKAPSKDERLFWPTEQEKQKAKELVSKINPSKKKVLLHAPSAHPKKMWDINNWVQIVKFLKDKECSIVFSGAQSDVDYYKQIEAVCGFSADLNLCKTQNTLRDNVAVYEHCDFAVCVDSGPMHLAAAVDVPVIGLFGPSYPIRWEPWSDKSKVVKSDTDSLNDLKVEEVIDSISQML